MVVEVCLEGLVGVWVLLNAVSWVWHAGKVKVEVLRVVEEPGFVSVG